MRTNRIDVRLLPPRYWERERVPFTQLRFRDEEQRKRLEYLLLGGAPLYCVSPLGAKPVRITSKPPWP